MYKRICLEKLLFGLGVVVLVVIAGCSSGSNNQNTRCTPGTQDCKCKADGSCDTGLECKANKCVKSASCTPGTLDCKCKADGSCDTGLECKANKCVKSASCTPGTLDCKCKADGSCDTGLECKANKCVKPQQQNGLTIGNDKVRSCDLLFAIKGLQAEFSEGVRGVVKHGDGKTAISLISTTDTAFNGVVATLTDIDGQEVSGITPDEVHCYDRLGKEIDAPGVEIR